jgi:uncharacterized damage-inducible protein DinB
MQRTKWIERKFAPIEDNGLLPGIIERLEGTPARLYYKTGKLDNQVATSGSTKWSIKKEIGHLSDLEPLWLQRVGELLNDQPTLSAADMSNARTEQATHDDNTYEELLVGFFAARMKLVGKLKTLSEEDLNKTSLHPRLQMPMRIIDLAYFVAEHDDHHMAQITLLINSDTSWMTQNVL